MVWKYQLYSIVIAVSLGFTDLRHRMYYNWVSYICCCRFESKLAAFVGQLVKYLLLLLLLAVLLLIICSMKPGWCRLGLSVDWRMHHVGSSPPV